MTTIEKNMTIPEIIFIVPYRNRLAHYNVFLNHMPYILEDLDKDSYEIYFTEPIDDKPFNRGATKNLGFLYIKQKYPKHYKNMTFVFHDVDILPGIKNLWEYKTKKGTIKHFYGFTFALGGIVSINGEDFENINGFPNYWGWGFEDNALYNRCIKNKLIIDRNIFYQYNDNNILQFFHGKARKIDNTIVHKYQTDNGNNGLNKISNIKFELEILKFKFFKINIKHWEIPEKHTNIIYETKIPGRKIRQRKVELKSLLKF